MFEEYTTTNPSIPTPHALSVGIETASGLWAPRGSVVEMPYVAGPDADTARRVVVHRFRFHDPQSGRGQICHVPAHPDASPSEIEDMAARAFESFLSDARRLPPIGKHTPEQRKEIGAAIREFSQYAAKRRQSSTGKIYH